ncbi:glycine cleavage system aminomethyltransferase GcvT [Methylomonas sp. UP202]|uniref:glycine cleavage system aminomethyltransferase GcvT n=1 Tax=Methylomonas sp. UP202 TaxID=3040943 RepID=UPI00247B1F22|nr:glycine cleavage system aminomethyltransferase GcvT [Methylomonas sp. UP202]WGS83819.1 glycine cleavage system aminomethyltransferase GcvT [Methylomonas sp. UP202]
MSELKTTPLYDLHGRLGAKMTAFAGYRMPVQYRNGILREHRHCREQAGLFDISHMGQCLVLGKHAAEALDQLTPGGMTELTIGAQKYSVLTHPDGGVIDDIIVTRIPSGVSIVVNAGCKAGDFAYLQSVLPASCEFVEQSELALLALQGPAAATILEKLSPSAAALKFMQVCDDDIAGIACHISRSGYTGEDGFELSVQVDDVERLAVLLLEQDGVAPIGLGARDTLRLEAGLCLYGHELSADISPVDAGLSWVFKQGHQDFPGSSIILPQLQHGPRRRRVGLSITGKMPVRDGAKLFAGERPVGVVTSGGYSPTLGRPIAMALVEAACSRVGTELLAQVRDQTVQASVCRLPFVPHRYRR